MIKKTHARPKSFKLKNVLVAILLLTISTTFLFTFTACNKTPSNFTELKKGSRPDYTSIISASDSAIINSAMSASATEEQKKSAVLALYQIANKSRQQTSLSLMLQNSNAGISAGDVIMHAFNLKNGDKWYYQLVTQVSTGNAGFDTIMSAFAGLLKVAYSFGNGEYWYSLVKGSKSEGNCDFATFPYATFILTEQDQPKLYDENEFKKELHYLESMHEINNMNFVKDIIADGAEITYNQAEKYYTVKFAVDMDADSQLLEQWFALPKQDMAAGGQTLVRYNYYEAVLEVWDNGYAKSFKSNSDRTAAMVFASGKPTDEFEYIWNEDEILSLLKEDQSLNRYEKFDTVDEYLNYYCNPLLEKAKLGALAIAGIVIASIIVVIVIIIAVVETLVKKGKLPKLAKRRLLSRAKHIAQKHDRALQRNKKSAKVKKSV